MVEGNHVIYSPASIMIRPKMLLRIVPIKAPMPADLLALGLESFQTRNRTRPATGIKKLRIPQTIPLLLSVGCWKLMLLCETPHFGHTTVLLSISTTIPKRLR